MNTLNLLNSVVLNPSALIPKNIIYKTILQHI